MTITRWFRIALGYMVAVSAQIGFWALFAPRSFYDDFPGLGRAWVTVDGPYNEHLVRDVGALNLAMVVILVIAAVTLVRIVVITAAAASLAWGVPHLTYHVFNTDALERSDIAFSLGGLVAFAAVPVALIAMSGRLSDQPSQAGRLAS